jgi:hypothetical protein
VASLLGILGQASPNGGVVASLYIAPSNKHATVRLVVCNRDQVDLFTVAISPNGAALESKHYLVKDMPIAANDSLSSSAFTIQEGDVVRVASSNGNVSFTLTGIEEDS